MVKLKDLWNGPDRNSYIFLAVITLAFIFSILFLGDNNLVNLVKVELELGRQQDQIEKYTREIEEMDARINMLQHNRDTLEEFAREQFYFAAPGDDVYIVE
ncbi:MAG: septum formation initiator family protein [Candidatus Cryptobacteroides sp.]